MKNRLQFLFFSLFMSSENPLVPISTVKRRRDDDGSAVATDIRENPLVPVEERKKVVVVKRTPKTTTTTTTVVAAAPKKSKSKSTRIIPEDPQLVSVKGNPKVQRCLRCMTFVKAGASHPLSECNARLANKANKKSSGGKGYKRKYRLTKKRYDFLDRALGDSVCLREVNKQIPRLKKWLEKKRKNCSKTTIALMEKIIDAAEGEFDFLKKHNVALRRAGLWHLKLK